MRLLCISQSMRKKYETQNSEYLFKIIRCEIIDSSLQSPNSLVLNFFDFATGGEYEISYKFSSQQTRLSEWADMVRDCQNRPQGMKIDEWCQLHDITKASYYWRLRKVREAYLKTADHTQTFVEVPSSAIQPVNMAAEYKIIALIRGRNNLTLEITEQASDSFLKTLLGVLGNAQ